MNMLIFNSDSHLNTRRTFYQVINIDIFRHSIAQYEGSVWVCDKFMGSIIKPPPDTPRSLPSGYSDDYILER